MAELRKLVLELAALPPGEPVATLYLDTNWHDEQQRERVKLFVRERIREGRLLFGHDGPAIEAVEKTLDRIEVWVEDVVNQTEHPEARGMLLVASEGRGLFREYELGIPVEPAFFLDVRPRLFPLVRAMSRTEPVILATVDSTGADIIERRYGEIEQEETIEREIPRRHRSTVGWSQEHFPQHLRQIIKGVWKECARTLEQALLAHPDCDVILFGQRVNVAGFEKLLTKKSRDRVIAARPLPPDRNALMASADEAIEQALTQRASGVVHHILRQGLSERSGTIGLQQTLLAANERRVRVLAVSERFEAAGYLCQRCEGLWTSGATGCVFCGGPTESILLREELARRCLSEKGQVLVVPAGGPLDTYAGIGALLRHLKGPEKQSPAGAEQGASA
jgi:hypothetical protein